MERLKVEGLKKQISNKIIIDDINIKLYSGEILGIIGPNGAGKTTLLKAISGLININQGVIDFDGLSFKNNREKILSNMGVVIEKPCFYEHLTARKNIEIFSKMKSDMISEKRINYLFDYFKLKNYQKRKFANYSLGMKQRLALIEILLSNPEILILDEPTNGLDPRGVVEFREKLSSLSKNEGKSIIISSHNLEEVKKICDNYLFMKNGKLVFSKKIKASDYILKVSKGNIEEIKKTLNRNNIEYIYSSLYKNDVFTLNLKKEELLKVVGKEKMKDSYISEIGEDLELLYLSIT
ncbi:MULTISPECIES: ABC transporter ATP-binding protein [Bacillota]|uniref:ABC transporter, ATP-binding protein n=1 Tax=Veillonella atypica TaxID=39777 RepID=A0A133S5K8_9FIRM|nr:MULTISPECIES: ABC transporter ATP-binding protein [Bacillota]KXA64948.1 ABC transporter, ATP-binding protein [Veillonella atypica]